MECWFDKTGQIWDCSILGCAGLVFPVLHYSSSLVLQYSNTPVLNWFSMLNYNHYEVVIIEADPPEWRCVGASGAGLKRILLLERHPSSEAFSTSASMWDSG